MSWHVLVRDVVADRYRPEKEHWKQIEALAALFARRPDFREAGVRLVMMGGARHPRDEARVEELRALAVKRGVQVRLTICQYGES